MRQDDNAAASYAHGATRGPTAEIWDHYYATHQESDVLWNLGSVDPSMEAAMSEVQQHRVSPPLRGLDVGCGLGHDALYMVLQNFTVTCLDASEKALARARSRVTSERIEFVKATLGRESARGTVAPLGRVPCYDIIWVRSVLQHLSDADARGVLVYLRSLLRPSGLLVLKEFDMAGCEDIAGLNTMTTKCGQLTGPVNARDVNELLAMLHSEMPSCQATPSSLRTVCGEHICAQVYKCAQPHARTAQNGSLISNHPTLLAALLAVAALLVVGLCAVARCRRWRCAARAAQRTRGTAHLSSIVEGDSDCEDEG